MGYYFLLILTCAFTNPLAKSPTLISSFPNIYAILYLIFSILSYFDSLYVSDTCLLT